jgi:predicted nucleic acid-binding protein
MLRIVQRESIVWYSTLLEIELAEVGYRLALKEIYAGRWTTARLDGRARRRASSKMERLTAAWSELLGTVPSAKVSMDPVAGDVPRLMKLGLGSYDAVHAATASHVGVNNIVTTDKGFGHLPESVNLYVDASRTTACRRLRGGR